MIGVPKETEQGERRVALVPAVVQRLGAAGLAVTVEGGAGDGARIPDSEFERAGAVIGNPWTADVVVKVSPPTAEETARLSPRGTLVGFLAPLTRPEVAAGLRKASVTGFAMEAVPRISRAQSMDALSSQANVAGYKAVIEAARHCTRFFPMLTTAAGTVKPATVLVLGAGVAGLQALATAKRLGARTTGFDVRPEVAEQVRSLGAQWLETPRLETRWQETPGLEPPEPEAPGPKAGISAVGDGGYARALTAEEEARQQRQLTEAVTRFDVVITTAQVPGRPAPLLVTAEAVRRMRPGSVVVDLAGEGGGNCELTEPGETVIHNGVTVCGPLNLPATLPEHASELYARNVQALLGLLIDGGKVAPDFSDEILARCCVTRDDPEDGPEGGSEGGSEGGEG
ncbi:MAG: NAD(P) transhydrogenase subunit alpha [Nocardiopsaceae bacterium]|nr:NAD(P) transhydrogenase subunit alpha [Nocardiopsaceae bacterium]